MNEFENDLVGIIDSIDAGSQDMSAQARATALIDEARDFKITFGRRCLNAILKHCGFLDAKIARTNTGAVDPNGTLVLVGMHNVGTFIMNRRSLDITTYERMLKQSAKLEGDQ